VKRRDVENVENIEEHCDCGGDSKTVHGLLSRHVQITAVLELRCRNKPENNQQRFSKCCFISLFFASARMSADDRRKRKTFLEAVKRVAEQLKVEAPSVQNVPTLESFCYKLTIEDSDRHVHNWLLVQCIGFDSLHDLDSIRNVFE